MSLSREMSHKELLQNILDDKVEDVAQYLSNYPDKNIAASCSSRTNIDDMDNPNKIYLINPFYLAAIHGSYNMLSTLLQSMSYKRDKANGRCSYIEGNGAENTCISIIIQDERLDLNDKCRKIALLFKHGARFYHHYIDISIHSIELMQIFIDAGFKIPEEVFLMALVRKKLTLSEHYFKKLNLTITNPTLLLNYLYLTLIESNIDTARCLTTNSNIPLSHVVNSADPRPLFDNKSYWSSYSNYPSLTLIHFMCFEALADSIIFLLENGADLNLQDEHGRTALLMLTESNAQDKKPETLKLLMRYCMNTTRGSQQLSEALNYRDIYGTNIKERCKRHAEIGGTPRQKQEDYYASYIQPAILPATIMSEHYNNNSSRFFYTNTVKDVVHEIQNYVAGRNCLA